MQQGAIAAEGTSTFGFTVATNDDNAAIRACTVILKDANGDMLDRKTVGFNTTALVLSNNEFYTVNSSK